MQPGQGVDLRQEPNRLHGVDGLRAVAMTMVIAQHSGLLPFGWTGVWLFYVISGYVIARGFEGHASSTSTPPPAPRVLAFWRRRAARIVPAYLVYLLVNLLLLAWLERPEPLLSLPALLAFVHNWQMIFWPAAGAAHWPAFGHLWTLSVEQQFYWVFPLLVVCLPARQRVTVSVALIVLSPLFRWAWSGWLQSQGWPDGQVAFGVYAASHVQFDAFLMGSLIAQAEHAGALHGPSARRRLRAAWACTGAALAAYLAVYLAVNHGVRGAEGLGMLHDVVSGVLLGEHREVWVYSVVSLLAAAAVAQVVTDRWSPRPGWLASPLWSAIGRASYSGYLYHLLVLWLMGSALDTRVRDLPVPSRLAAFAAAWLLTVLLSRCSHRWVEVPAQRWLSGGRPSPAAPALEPEPKKS